MLSVAAPSRIGSRADLAVGLGMFVIMPHGQMAASVPLLPPGPSVATPIVTGVRETMTGRVATVTVILGIVAATLAPRIVIETETAVVMLGGASRETVVEEATVAEASTAVETTG